MCRAPGLAGRAVAGGVRLSLIHRMGLQVQSYSPRRQKYGLMNADGWGVGF